MADNQNNLHKKDITMELRVLPLLMIETAG